MFRHSLITSAILTPFLVSSVAFAEDKGLTMEVGALVEVELDYRVDNTDSNDPNTKDTSSSDISVATVELYFDGQLTDWISGHVQLLWEQDVTDPIDMDEAYIAIANEEISSMSYIFGKMYTPFGSFESNMIFDPLTLELGETNESAALIGYDNNFYALGYIFNGDINETSKINDGDNNIDNFGLKIGYAIGNETFSIDAGVDYINNLADSDVLQVFTVNGLESFVAGLGVHANFNFGMFTVIAEYVDAMDDFQVNELIDEDNNPLNTQKRSPSAYNIEAGFEIGTITTLAVGYQGSSDAMDIGFPESVGLIAVGLDIADSTGLSFELAFPSEYSTSEGGDGETDIVFTTQLAIEF